MRFELNVTLRSSHVKLGGQFAVEGVARAVAGGFASGDASGHAGDGGPADDGLRHLGMAFVVPGQAPAGSQPGQRPFHQPTCGR